MPEKLESAAVRGAAAALGRLSPRRAAQVGRGIGRAAYALGIRRRVCRDNLARAFGTSRTPAELARLARDAYAHLGHSFSEFLTLPRTSEPSPSRALDDAGRAAHTAELSTASGSVRVALPAISFEGGPREWLEPPRPWGSDLPEFRGNTVDTPGMQG
jgi:lauroyl/myristoyl acyltransferase